MSAPGEENAAGNAAVNTTSARRQRWSDVRRLLAVRTDNLGDVLMTTPALAALRQRLPEAHITLLTSKAGAAAAAHIPVDEAWACSPAWTPQGQAAEALADRRAALGHRDAELVDRIAEGGFDAAVVFTVSTQSALPAALVCRMAGVPLRLAHARENPYALLTDWVPETDRVETGMRHEVRRQLDLVASIGAVDRGADGDRLRFTVHEADRQRVRARLAAAGLRGLGDRANDRAGGGFVLLHPGASAASRRWPAPAFGHVGAALAQLGWPVVVAGADGDIALVQAVCSAMLAAGAAPPLALAGELSLGELAALVEAAAVLVGNNSAPSHLAAALGTPVVNLYALTNPQHTPWQVPHRVLSHDVSCRWCLKSACPEHHHLCLLGVREEAVVDATLALLAERGVADGVMPTLTDVIAAGVAAPADHAEHDDPADHVELAEDADHTDPLAPGDSPAWPFAAIPTPAPATAARPR